MNILGTLTRLLPASGLAGGRQHWTPDWMAGAGTTPARRNDPTPSESARHSPIYAAVASLSSSLASVRPELVAIDATGARLPTRGIAAGDALKEWQLHEREAVYADALLGGNGFAEIIRDGRGAVSRLSWMPAWRVKIGTHDGRFWYILDADESVNEPARVLSADDVLHIKYRMVGSANRLFGISPLAQIAPSLGLVVAIREQATTIFRNFALPLSVLQHPKTLSGDAAKRLKTAFMNAIGGDQNGSPAVLQEGMTLTQLDVAKAVDMQLNELLAVTIAEAARAYGIPAYLLSQAESTYATAAESARQYVLHSLKPWSARVADAIDHALLTPQQRANGIQTHFDLSPLTLGFGTELSEYISRLTVSGVLSANEARAMIGLPSRDDGQQLRFPVNLSAASEHVQDGSGI